MYELHVRTSPTAHPTKRGPHPIAEESQIARVVHCHHTTTSYREPSNMYTECMGGWCLPTVTPVIGRLSLYRRPYLTLPLVTPIPAVVPWAGEPRKSVSFGSLFVSTILDIVALQYEPEEIRSVAREESDLIWNTKNVEA